MRTKSVNDLPGWASLGAWSRCRKRPSRTSFLTLRRLPDLLVESRPECRCFGGIVPVLLAKFCCCFLFLASRKPQIHEHQDRKHHQCNEGRPLQQEASHDQDKADILRMPHTRIESGSRKPMLALGLIQHVPRRGQHDEPAKYQNIAHYMERSEVRTGAPTEDNFKQVPRIVRQEIDARELL